MKEKALKTKTEWVYRKNCQHLKWFSVKGNKVWCVVNKKGIKWKSRILNAGSQMLVTVLMLMMIIIIITKLHCSSPRWYLIFSINLLFCRGFHFCSFSFFFEILVQIKVTKTTKCVLKYLFMHLFKYLPCHVESGSLSWREIKYFITSYKMWGQLTNYHIVIVKCFI